MYIIILQKSGWGWELSIATMENQFKPRICEWEDLSLTNTEALQTCGVTVEAVKKVLKEILGVSSEDKQSTIELDLYTHALLFAKTNKFSLPQMSAFFTILKSVHKLCISTPFDNQEQALELFNNLLIRHGVSRPPYSVMLFSLQQVKIITDYVLSTYFKHYKMYKYAFTKKVRLSLRLAYSGEDVGEEENKEEEDEKEDTKIDPVEEPDFVEDIEEGMRIHMYSYITPNTTYLINPPNTTYLINPPNTTYLSTPPNTTYLVSPKHHTH